MTRKKIHVGQNERDKRQKGMRAPPRLISAVRRTVVKLRKPIAIAKTMAMKAIDADTLSSLQEHSRDKLTAMMQKNAVDDVVSTVVELSKHWKFIPVYISKFITVGAEGAYAASFASKLTALALSLLHF